jgi:hypothetical protein
MPSPIGSPRAPLSPNPSASLTDSERIFRYLHEQAQQSIAAPDKETEMLNLLECINEVCRALQKEKEKFEKLRLDKEKQSSHGFQFFREADEELALIKQREAHLSVSIAEARADIDVLKLWRDARFAKISGKGSSPVTSPKPSSALALATKTSLGINELSPESEEFIHERNRRMQELRVKQLFREQHKNDPKSNPW